MTFNTWPVAVFLAVVLGLAGHCPGAELAVSALFGDHMVLQRDMQVPVWGTAPPGASLTVSVAGASNELRAAGDGRWKTTLGPLPAGGPHELRIATHEHELRFSDVFVGDVWLCSGQSNMTMTVAQSKDAEKEIAAAMYPEIRLFNVTLEVSPEPRDDCAGQWTHCTSETVSQFSAVAYHFGRALQERLDVPIGLILSACNGTPVESWVSRDVLRAHDDFQPILNFWEHVCEGYPKRLAEHQRAMEEWEAAAEAARKAGQSEPQGPYKVLGPGHEYEPGGLYNGSIHPIIPFGLRGAIWYQGESNTDRADQYSRLFPALIRDWRERWGQGPFPFLFVQLPELNEKQVAPDPGSQWAEFREAQCAALSLPNTAMAVALGLGDPDDIHPKNKQDVGRRLALAALTTVYKTVDSGLSPMYSGHQIDGNKVHVRFANVEGGLIVDESKQNDIEGFIVAGSDRNFVWAQAEIVAEDEVIVWAESVEKPVAIRYAWSNNPLGNLRNIRGLPMAPFRTDGWPMESEGRTVTTFPFLGAPVAETPPGGE